MRNKTLVISFDRLAQLLLGAGLLFFAHEKTPAHQQFSVRPLHEARYEEHMQINQLSWFVAIQQDIFFFCQLHKWHCPWGCSVDFSRHMVFTNCISGPADLAALWVSALWGCPRLSGPPLSSPLWSLMGRLRGSCSPAPLHTSLAPFWVLFKLTLALWLLHWPLPSLSPFLPFFTFFLSHLLPSFPFPSGWGIHLPDAMAYFSWLPGSRFWLLCSEVRALAIKKN